MFADIVAFIDMLLNITGIGKDIRNSQKAEKKEYFEKIIEPLYLELKTLHEYYLNLFRESKNYIENGNSNLKKILVDFDQEIKFNSTNRIGIENQLSILISAEKKISKIDYPSLRGFLESVINYLTCPKSSRFLRYEDLELAASGEEVEPFKLGMMGIMPIDLLCIAASVKDPDLMQKTHLPSIRHLFRQRLFALVERRSVDVYTLLWFDKSAKKEIIEAVEFLVEELNINYEITTKFFFAIKHDLFS